MHSAYGHLIKKEITIIHDYPLSFHTTQGIVAAIDPDKGITIIDKKDGDPVICLSKAQIEKEHPDKTKAEIYSRFLKSYTLLIKYISDGKLTFFFDHPSYSEKEMGDICPFS